MTTPPLMTAAEALKFLHSMKILPRNQPIVQFDFSMTPIASDIVYYIPEDEKSYGGNLAIGEEQQQDILEFFGVANMHVTCLNVCTHDLEVYVDVTLVPESRK